VRDVAHGSWTGFPPPGDPGDRSGSLTGFGIHFPFSRVSSSARSRFRLFLADQLDRLFCVGLKVEEFLPLVRGLAHSLLSSAR
jgi:hypothetical protein